MPDETVRWHYSRIKWHITEILLLVILTGNPFGIGGISLPLQPMNRRIKIVWALSIITMVLILCSQAYWLYNQYMYSTENVVKEMQVACDTMLQKEYQIRYHRYEVKERKRKGVPEGMRVDSMAIMMRTHQSLHFSLDDGGVVEAYTLYTLRHPKIKEAKLYKGSMDKSMEYAHRYLTHLSIPLSRHLMDSLLMEDGFGPIQNARIHRSNEVVQPARFSVSGNMMKTLHVEFSTNPFAYQNLHFDLPVPVSSVIRSMAWQLAGVLLLLLVLAFCLIYQIRTIMIQKRIDTIRREVMKNIIYEMKQPEEPTDENMLRIGSTDFYYSLNELRHGPERVIITSRQAELLRLLAEHLNEVVPREQILQQIWGDDSYSNSLALNVQITYLRRALKSDESLAIEAVIRKGYVLKHKDNAPEIK